MPDPAGFVQHRKPGRNRILSDVSGWFESHRFQNRLDSFATKDYLVAMHGTIDTLTQDAMHLSEDQRITLAHRLLSSIEPPESEQIESAWNTEIKRRISRFRKGLVETIPADEVFAQLDARLK